MPSRGRDFGTLVHAARGVVREDMALGAARKVLKRARGLAGAASCRGVDSSSLGAPERSDSGFLGVAGASIWSGLGAPERSDSGFLGVAGASRGRRVRVFESARRGVRVRVWESPDSCKRSRTGRQGWRLGGGFGAALDPSERWKGSRAGRQGWCLGVAFDQLQCSFGAV